MSLVLVSYLDQLIFDFYVVGNNSIYPSTVPNNSTIFINQESDIF